MEKEAPLAQFAAATLRLRLRENREPQDVGVIGDIAGGVDGRGGAGCRQLQGTELSEKIEFGSPPWTRFELLLHKTGRGGTDESPSVLTLSPSW
jgi:hypothetical protein